MKNDKITQLPVAQSSAAVAPRLTPQTLTAARRIDEIASGALAHFEGAGKFEQELQVATAMQDMLACLTPEVMAPVMSLMNTDLGFRTDRDPSVTPGATPYPFEVVARVFAESRLRGFHSIGNEFNIISSRFYATKAGLKRKVEQWPGVTDVKTDLGVPRQSGEKGAIVPVKAKWKRNGTADTIEAEIPVRVNSGMGVDAIIGKAERKIYKRIHDRLSGLITPDADEEAINIQAETTPAKPAASFGGEKSPTGAASHDPTSPQAAPPNPTPPPRPDNSASETAKPVSVTAHAVTEFANAVVAAGFSFADFKAYAKAEGTLGNLDLDTVNSFDDVPEPLAARLMRSITGLLNGIRRTKGGAK